MNESVLLLHGIWLRGVTLWPLARRLCAYGYRTEVVDYLSLLRGTEPCIAWLQRRLQESADRPLHMVGHSLGGVIAVEALARTPGLAARRVVCLGSPLSGSQVARTLQRVSGARLLLGRSAELLCRGIDAAPPGCQVGAIAGSLPIGFGRAIARYEGPHDGTVAVTETRIPGLADHVVLAATHTGLVLSAEAARLTATFLRQGHFRAAA